jgi:hypothetical protein
LNSSEKIELSLCFWLGEMAARTEAGHQHLQAMLCSSDSNTVRFSASCIYRAADLDDVALLLGAARAHRSSQSVVTECLDSARLLLGRPSLKLPSGGPEASCQLSALTRWVDAHRHLLTRKSYADYWGDELPAALRFSKNSKVSHEGQEYLVQTLSMLIMSQDTAHVVPAIMSAIEKVNPNEYPRSTLPTLMAALQVHLGPMDLPAADDLQEQVRAQKAVLAWWRANSGRGPGHWILSRLAERGLVLDTKSPREVVAWLRKALASDSTKNQYFACLLISHVFPENNALAAPDGTFLFTGTEPPPLPWKYVVSRYAADVEYWTLLCDVLRWVREEGRYGLGKRS